MRIMLSEDEIERLFLGQVVEQIFDAGETKIEIAMSDIGFLRLHELLNQAQAGVQSAPAPPAWGGNPY